MEQNLSLKEGLFEKEFTILDLSTASGAALAVEDNILTLGECPQRHDIEQIIEWAAAQELPSVFCTREFNKYYPPALAFKGVASGVMLIEVSKHSKDYILCFKPQITETISWAGNPDKSLEMDDQKKLHPRKSFEKWEQQIEGKSAPWSALEEERANSLAKSAVSIQLRCQAEKLKKLNEKLEVTLSELKNKNEQLEDFTRIASHNLLSPLNTIVALIQLYNSKADFETARLALTNIEKVGKNMHQTLKDLHQILKVGSSKDLPKEAVDISLLIEKEKQGLHNLILEKGANIETEISVPIIVYPKVYLESILHNFLSNALKYSSPERKPVIKIQTFEQKDKVALKITDNGLGIDLAKHGQKLFGLYKTFHQKADSRGLGLYLVKKQVESLEGEIGVDSQVGKGTSFCILLPKWRKDIP